MKRNILFLVFAIFLFTNVVFAEDFMPKPTGVGAKQRAIIQKNVTLVVQWIARIVGGVVLIIMFASLIEKPDVTLIVRYLIIAAICFSISKFAGWIGQISTSKQQTNVEKVNK